MIDQDHDKECGQHKINSPGINSQQASQDTAQDGAEDPVGVIQKGYEQIKPSFLHSLRDIGGAQDGKALIRQGEDEIGLHSAGSPVGVEHGDAIEDMPCIDSDGHQKSAERIETDSQKGNGHKLHGTGINKDTGQNDPKEGEALVIHENAVGCSKDKVSGKNRDGMRKSSLKGC